MTEEQPTEVNNASAVPAKTAGAMLSEARQSIGLSILDVAKRMNLTELQIKQLEADDFSDFSTPAFVRGYLRGYARLVRLSDQEVIAAYHAENKDDTSETETMVSFSNKEAIKKGDKSVLFVSAGLFVAVAATVVVWIFQEGQTPVGASSQSSSSAPTQISTPRSTNNTTASFTQSQPSQTLPSATTSRSLDSSDASFVSADDSQMSEENTSTASEPENTALTTVDNDVIEDITRESSTSTTTEEQTSNRLPQNVDDVLVESEQSADTETQITENTTTESASEIPETSADASTSNTFAQTQEERVIDDVLEDSTTEEVTATQQTTELGATALSLRFNSGCWAKVVDATGEVLVLGTKQGGHVSNVEGVAPFEVLLGNPQAVAIYVNEQVFNKPATEPGQIARFTIDIEE